MKNKNIFLKQAQEKAFDKSHRKRIKFNMGKYHESVKKGEKQLLKKELSKKQAEYIKKDVIQNLDKYLLEFEENFTKNGGKVLWASDRNEALTIISDLLKKNKVKKVVKMKSMVSEELGINEHLIANNITPIETDLGEYIVQLNNERPYHIVTPVMHKSKDDIAQIFHDKLGTNLNLTAQELTLKAREILRTEFTSAQAGITGGNFLIAKEGALSLTENEGNGRLSTAFPKLHISIVGIEKVVPSISQLAILLPLLSAHGTGQKITSYNSLVFGPKKETEIDGPQQMYVILLDNGRSKILKNEPQRQALACIRCGACLNNCPVYKNIGGHTYQAAYNGPIGSVITPFIDGFEEKGHIALACSVCGACKDVCPVKIDLPKLIIANREKLKTNMSENVAWYFWKKMMLNRNYIDFIGGKAKNNAIKLLSKYIWGKRRKRLKFANKSFSKMWKEQNKKKSLNK